MSRGRIIPWNGKPLVVTLRSRQPNGGLKLLGFGLLCSLFILSDLLLKILNLLELLDLGVKYVLLVEDRVRKLTAVNCFS